MSSTGRNLLDSAESFCLFVIPGSRDFVVMLANSSAKRTTREHGLAIILIDPLLRARFEMKQRD
jgi:hypothetical protein